MAWLYRYEAKGIQSYVLGTQRLKEIAGASRLVDDLPSDARELLAASGGGEPLVLAAGNGMIRFESKEALVAFAKHWPLFCERTRPGLHMVQAWVELGTAKLDQSTTNEVTQTLFRRIEQARMQPAVCLPEAGPWMARSGRTGLPATTTDGARGLLDALGYAKQRAFRDDADDRQIGLGARLLHDIDGVQRRAFVKDNDTFAEGYVAVVHADGNSIGKWFRTIPLDQQSRFSTALQASTVEATRTAIKAVMAAEPAGKTRGFLPLRPIVLGGDDLTAVVEAKYAVVFTKAFLVAFEHETRSKLESWLKGASLTACAGLAFVKPTFPFYAAYDLAEELCQHAKKSSSPNATKPSSLVFHRVTTAAVESWDEICEDELASITVDGSRSTMRKGALVGGPWRVDEGDSSYGLASLAGLVGFLANREIPRGSLREWIRLAQHDRQRADVAWDRMREVLRDHEKESGTSVLDSTLAALGGQRSGWREDGTTPMGDALSLAAMGVLLDYSSSPTEQP